MPDLKLMIETNISFYRNLKSPSVTIKLIEWIVLNTNKNEFSDLIIDYRRSGSHQLKKTLPLATVGGEFRNGRKLSDLYKQTGWLAIDIDHKDNSHFISAENIRDQIAKISFVAFSCLSVSGKGVWALIKIKDLINQADHFEQLKVDFASLNIHLDPTKGKNPNDARFLSYDPDAILKDDFKVYDRFPEKEEVKRSNYKSRNYTFNNSSIDFEHIVRQIFENYIDIAPDYETYRNIGFAIASEFGENGRQLFHDVVSCSPKYSRKDAEKQYTNCMTSTGSGITIGTLIHHCKQNNIDIRR